MTALNKDSDRPAAMQNGDVGLPELVRQAPFHIRVGYRQSQIMSKAFPNHGYEEQERCWLNRAEQWRQWAKAEQSLVA